MTASVPARSGAVIWALTSLAAIVMIGGAVVHFAAPQGFAPLVPPFLPAVPVILLAGVVQLVIGLAAFWPRTRAWGGLAFAAICAAYMPLHLWDYVRPDPVFAPPVAATIRVVIQGLFIWAGLALWRKTR
jgi:uncharacterized membrane protein